MHPRDPTSCPHRALVKFSRHDLGNSLNSGIRTNFIARTAVYRAKISVAHHSNSTIFSLVSMRHNVIVVIIPSVGGCVHIPARDSV